jgi:hypothetical protein
MRGRRPKPTQLKMLIGNPGNRPLNDDERNIPDCLPELSAFARQERGRLVGPDAACRADRARHAAPAGISF